MIDFNNSDFEGHISHHITSKDRPNIIWNKMYYVKIRKD